MEDLHVSPGDILASKYRVEKVLGVGGMGIVVAARHVALGNVVAIKLMQPRAFGVKGAADRFLREGQAAAQLTSPHVAKVLDVGQLDTGAPYMIMEHLHGADLSSVIEKRGAVPLQDAAEYILQACDAIGEAHAKGIIHRDLKPANLFLQVEPDGSPLIKVLDFGIAKIAGSDQKLTGTSQGMGSGGYMSPEQMSSAKKVDQRADIWALGVCLYELITAHLPFEADSLEQFVARVFFEQPTPLLSRRPELPVAIEALVFRCLEKQPDARFPTVAHFAAALAPFAPQRSQVYVARIAKQLGVDLPGLDRATAPPVHAAHAGTMLMQAAPPTTGPAMPAAPAGHAAAPTGPAGYAAAQTHPASYAAAPTGSAAYAAAPTGPAAMSASQITGPAAPSAMGVSSPSVGGLSSGQLGTGTAPAMGPPGAAPPIPPVPVASQGRPILIAVLAVVTAMAILAVVAWRIMASRTADLRDISASVTTADTTTATPPLVVPSTTTTSPVAEPSGAASAPPVVTADAGAPPVKAAVAQTAKPTVPAKTAAPNDPFGSKPISKDRGGH